jgi:two-component system, NarL family, nitrate/nitrite response regulator NarL
VRILVVDDHPVVRKGVCSVLAQREDIAVCAQASDGREALRQAMELVPDLVILDVSMPNVDGLAAAKLIKAAVPEVRILMLSVHDGPQIIRAAQAAGADGFLPKTEVGETLLEAVDMLGQGGTFFPTRRRASLRTALVHPLPGE